MAERCDVLVHHGGYGSCQTGLFAGRPAVIVPTYSERESNARRLEAIGAAKVVPVVTRGGKKHVDARGLSAAVAGVLHDPSFAVHARRAGERLRALGGAERAAELIADFALARRGAQS
jgi:UDP:flavonoid glycosyltransferase YjiC (YdhE family)